MDTHHILTDVLVLVDDLVTVRVAVCVAVWVDDLVAVRVFVAERSVLALAIVATSARRSAVAMNLRGAIWLGCRCVSGVDLGVAGGGVCPLCGELKQKV